MSVQSRKQEPSWSNQDRQCSLVFFETQFLPVHFTTKLPVEDQNRSGAGNLVRNGQFGGERPLGILTAAIISHITNHRDKSLESQIIDAGEYCIGLGTK
jgi:hypothetical protein